MKWNLRVQAAERGIWKSAELRRMLADAGLEISVGKMSGLWTGTPTTIRLDDLDVICHVLACKPPGLLVPEPEEIAARRGLALDEVAPDALLRARAAGIAEARKARGEAAAAKAAEEKDGE